MATNHLPVEATWVPDACTLPTAERPLRTAEFTDLLTSAVQQATRPAPTRLTLDLNPTPQVAAQTANLITRESTCCGFFTFTLTATSGALRLDITVPGAHTTVLDALAKQATPT